MIPVADLTIEALQRLDIKSGEVLAIRCPKGYSPEDLFCVEEIVNEKLAAQGIDWPVMVVAHDWVFEAVARVA